MSQAIFFLEFLLEKSRYNILPGEVTREAQNTRTNASHKWYTQSEAAAARTVGGLRRLTVCRTGSKEVQFINIDK